MDELAPLILNLQDLTAKLSQVGQTVEGASIGLQVKMDKAADRLAGKLDDSIGGLAKSLDAATAAAKQATEASNRYAARLVLATWALVVVTVGLAFITWQQG